MNFPFLLVSDFPLYLSVVGEDTQYGVCLLKSVEHVQPHIRCILDNSSYCDGVLAVDAG